MSGPDPRPAYDLTGNPYFIADADGHLSASFDGGRQELHVEPREGEYRCRLYRADYPEHNGIFAAFTTKDPREVLAIAVAIDNAARSHAGSNFGEPDDAPFTGFSHDGQHIHNPFADPQYGDWLTDERRELRHPSETYGAEYEGWLDALAAAGERRPMPGFAERIEREHEALQAGRHDRAVKASGAGSTARFRIEDADGAILGESHDPAVASRFAASRAALHACDLIAAAYAEGRDGGSVPWEMLDEAHAAALAALRSAHRAPEQQAAGFAGRVRRDGQGRGV